MSTEVNKQYHLLNQQMHHFDSLILQYKRMIDLLATGLTEQAIKDRSATPHAATQDLMFDEVLKLPTDLHRQRHVSRRIQHIQTSLQQVVKVLLQQLSESREQLGYLREMESFIFAGDQMQSKSGFPYTPAKCAKYFQEGIMFCVDHRILAKEEAQEALALAYISGYDHDVLQGLERRDPNVVELATGIRQVLDYKSKSDQRS